MPAASRPARSAPAPAPQPWLEELCFILFGLTDQLQQHFSDVAAAHGLSTPEGRALLGLGQTPRPMRQLAEKLGVDASYVTQLADALELRGLAERRADDRDRRARLFALTPDGLALRDRFRGELFSHVPGFEVLSEAERVTLLGLLRRSLRTRADGSSRGPDPTRSA